MELATKYVPLAMLAKLRGVSYPWLRANMAAGFYPVGQKVGGRYLIEARDVYEKFGIVITNDMIDEYKESRKEKNK